MGALDLPGSNTPSLGRCGAVPPPLESGLKIGLYGPPCSACMPAKGPPFSPGSSRALWGTGLAALPMGSCPARGAWEATFAFPGKPGGRELLRCPCSRYKESPREIRGPGRARDFAGPTLVLSGISQGESAGPYGKIPNPAEGSQGGQGKRATGHQPRLNPVFGRGGLRALTTTSPGHRPGAREWLAYRLALGWLSHALGPGLPCFSGLWKSHGGGAPCSGPGLPRDWAASGLRAGPGRAALLHKSYVWRPLCIPRAAELIYWLCWACTRAGKLGPSTLARWRYRGHQYGWPTFGPLIPVLDLGPFGTRSSAALAGRVGFER